MSRKQLTINMIANIISFTITTIVSFFLSPYIVNTVGKEAYGFVGLANNFVEYASLITIALNSMGGRFITLKIHKNDIEGANRYFNSILIANIVMGIVIMIPSLLIVIFIDNIINVPKEILLDVKLLWILTFFNFIISLITSTFGVATFAKNRLDLSSYLSIKSTLLRAIVLMSTFILFKPSVWYIGLASILCTIFVAIMNIRYTKLLLPELRFDKLFFNFKTVKELISSGIWNTFSKMASILSNGLDLLIANLFIGPAAMGNLSISKVMPMMTLSISGIISSVFSPNLTILYAKNDFEGMKKELLLSMKFLGIIMSIPLSGLIVYAGTFYKLWVPNENSQLLHCLSIICVVGLLFGSTVESLYNVFTVTNKLKINAIFNFICSIMTSIIVFVSVSIVESDLIGMFIIAGVSSMFSIVRNTIFLPLYSAKCLNFKWYTFYEPIIKNLVSTIVLTIISVVCLNIIHVDSWIKLIICAIVTVIIGVITNFFIVLSNDERTILYRKIGIDKRIIKTKLNIE